ERVHVHVIGFDLRIFGADSFEYALPQTSGVGHGIRFIAHEDSAARAAIDFFIVSAILVRIANNSLHAFAGVDVFLDRNFVGSSLFEHAAGVGVHAFGIFAEDHEIHILWFNAF